MNIAENIKRAYKLHGLTGTEVARKLGMVQPQFSRLINNPKIKVEDLEKIADAIGCSVVDLIDPVLRDRVHDGEHQSDDRANQRQHAGDADEIRGCVLIF